MDPQIDSQTPKRPSRGACRECASSKVKCLPQSSTNDGKCERCQLRGKACERRSAVVRKRRTPKNGRVAELEQRLDTIVTLLKSTQPQYNDDSLPRSMSTTLSPGSNALDDLANIATSQRAVPAIEQRPEFQQGRQAYLNYNNLKTQDPLSTPLPPNLDHPLQHSGDDDSNLEIFKTHLIWYFPFIVIPPETNAQMLRQQKPFLFRTIVLAVTHHQTWKRKEKWKEIVDHLSTHLLLRGERSLDLLQGLMVYNAWCNLSYYSNSRTSIWHSLAISVATELGLTKKPHLANKPWNSLIDATRSISKTMKPTHTMEDKRTLIGCYYLNSIISVCLEKMEPMRYSAYIETCCQDLFEAAESPTDRYLVQMVRLQRFSVKISQTFSDDVDAARNPSVPIGLYVHALSTELQTLKAAIPISLQNDTSILMHYYAASIKLYEIVFHEPQITVYPSSTPPLQRIEMLHSCLASSKSLTETFFLIPSSSYNHLPFTTFALFAVGLIALSRLCLLESPDWDRSHARSVANMLETLDVFARKLDEAHSLELAQTGEEIASDDAMFPTMATRVRTVISLYEAKLAAELNPVAHGQTENMGEDGMADIMNMDETFWQDFVVDWGNDFLS